MLYYWDVTEQRFITREEYLERNPQAKYKDFEEHAIELEEETALVPISKNRKWEECDYESFKREGRLILTEEVARKIFAYCQNANGEISGFAKVERTHESLHQNSYSRTGYEENPFVLTDVRIFAQECSQGGTHLNQNDLARFIVELVRAGKKPEDWNCWWHTHNDFGTLFSGTDTQTIKELSQESELLALCINKMGDMTARLDKNGEFVMDLKAVILPNQNTEIFHQCREEVKLKVKESKYEFHETKGFNQYGKSRKKWNKRYWRRRDW